MKESAKLQDIEAWIEMVKEGQTSKLTHFLNRITFPYYFGKTDKEWLEVLKFVRKQEIDKLKFFEKIKERKKK